MRTPRVAANVWLAHKVAVALTGLLAFVTLSLAICTSGASAGELDQAGVAKHFKEPFYIGERDGKLPIWPLFRHNIPASDDFIGYVFESVDFAPIAGYSGSPPNMLVAITPSGEFIAVSMISHNEPIFKHGAAEDQLGQFVEQFAKRKLSIKQRVKVSPTNSSGGPAAGGDTVWIDGIARATVSVITVNESVVASALKAARAKLGIAGGMEPGAAAKLKADSGATLTAHDIVERKYLAMTEITKDAVEKAFGNIFVRDVAPSPGTDPKAATTQAWTLYISAPEIGRAVLGNAAFAKLAADLHEGDHAILIGTKGRYGFRGGDERRGSLPENLVLSQDGLPIAVSTATNVDLVPSDELPKASNWVVVKVLKETGFDPTRDFQLVLRLTRTNSEVFPRPDTKDFTIGFKPPAEYFTAADVALSGWRAVWHEQRAQIGLAAVAITLLSLALAMQKRLTSNVRSFDMFRAAFLMVTLVGIGWWGQGQLSINNLIGVINAAKAGGDFSYLLFDPVSLLLWGFVFVTLVLYGRGTFCGWLCPFGAIQEFIGNIASRLKVPQITIPYAIDRKLRLLKYVVLAGIVGSAFSYAPAAEWLAEIEPFKTSITLGFDRSWPFVLYAVAVLLFSAFVYKGFCLYLCPLGATLALLGRVRVLNWIPRRKECGSPCQLCAVKCRYGAIEPKGAVRYDECFQCMDCVVIHNDETTCVPLILARKGKAMPAARRPNGDVRPVKELAI
ncbi:MAG: 4Fe-4S binding protein [Hyphomicrobium sp.]